MQCLHFSNPVAPTVCAGSDFLPISHWVLIGMFSSSKLKTSSGGTKRYDGCSVEDRYALPVGDCTLPMTVTTVVRWLIGIWVDAVGVASATVCQVLIMALHGTDGSSGHVTADRDIHSFTRHLICRLSASFVMSETVAVCPLGLVPPGTAVTVWVQHVAQSHVPHTTWGSHAAAN